MHSDGIYHFAHDVFVAFFYLLLLRGQHSTPPINWAFYFSFHYSNCACTCNVSTRAIKKLLIACFVLVKDKMNVESCIRVHRTYTIASLYFHWPVPN